LRQFQYEEFLHINIYGKLVIKKRVFFFANNIWLRLYKGIRCNNVKFERIAGSLKDDLGKHILWGEWSEAQTIFDKYPDMVRIPLNDSRRDTALNVAVYGGSITCEEGLVKLMNPEDLLIPNSQERLTVHLAALYGDNKMVQVLSSENVLDKMTSKDIQRLFFYDHRKQHVW